MSDIYPQFCIYILVKILLQSKLSSIEQHNYTAQEGKTIIVYNKLK